MKVHWVNGVGEECGREPHQMAWEKRRKVELGRVGRKCKGHWVNGVGEENGDEPE